MAPNRVAQLILFASALAFATVASAGLKDKPPKGVTLAGTGWVINPYQSDDPNAVIDKAEREQEEAQIRRRSNEDPGRVFDDTLGRGNSPGGTYRRPSPPGGEVPGNDMPGGGIPSDRGGWGHDQGRTSTTIDPTGGSQSATIQLGSRGGVSNTFLNELTHNPDKLSFVDVNQGIRVSADKDETECTPGSKVPISDSYGDGERTCGWEGRAWVIQTKRGNHFSRTDRYELSKDGKTLSYTTYAVGTRMPKITISRTYTVAPATTPD